MRVVKNFNGPFITPISEPFDLFCTTHRGRKISQYYYAVHKIMRSFRKYTCKHVRATRKRQNLRPFLKRDYVSITLRSWNAAIVSVDGIRNASWGNRDYVLVYHEVFSTVYFLLVPAFKCHRLLIFPSCESGERYLFQLLLFVPTTQRKQPCCWLCILYLCSYSATKQVST